MHYQKRYSTLYCTKVLPTGWTDNQGYRQVPGLRNFTKFYLRAGWMAKDTDRYLFLEIITKSYLRGGQTIMDTDGYLVLNNYLKFYRANRILKVHI